MRRTTLYTLEVTLTDGYMTDGFVRANPVVSRTVEIRADQTLNQLQRTILEAFDSWDASHLSEFNLGAGIMDRAGDRYVLPFVFAQPRESDDHPPTGSMTQARLGGLGLEVGSVFWYCYDYDDDWQHRYPVALRDLRLRNWDGHHPLPGGGHRGLGPPSLPLIPRQPPHGPLHSLPQRFTDTYYWV